MRARAAAFLLCVAVLVLTPATADAHPLSTTAVLLDIASDEVTGLEAARILSGILHRPVSHPQAIPAPLAPMAPFFRWLADGGFHADIRELRTHHPEIGWHSLRHWAAEHDWATPAP